MNFRHPPSYSLTTSNKKTIHEMHDDPSDTPAHLYNISTSLARQHSTTMKTSQRLAINHGDPNTPAPNLYDPRPTSPRNPKATFNKAKQANPENEVPPCTWYKPEEKLVTEKVKCYSIGQKYPSVLESQHKHPGPGHYQTSSPMLKSKSQSTTSFSHTHRFHQMKLKTPGVGSYSIEDEDFLKGKTSTIPKDSSYKHLKNAVPGPSDYPIKSQFEHKVEGQPGKTLSCRLKNPHQMPDYTSFAFLKYFDKPEDALKVLRASEKFSFGRSQRELFGDNKMPGPTDYINDSIKPKTSVHTVFPKSKHEIKEDYLQHPGPGAYQIQNQPAQSFSIGKSKSMANIADTPGVGRYNMSSSSSLRKGVQKRGNVFPKGKRASFVSTNLAGVGDYQIGPPTKSPKIGFSKAERFAKVEHQPGPGDYHINSIIGYQHKSKNK